jgi:phosphomannomutase
VCVCVFVSMCGSDLSAFLPQGFVQYVLATSPDVKQKGIVLGYDGRHNSSKSVMRCLPLFYAYDCQICFCVTLFTPFIPLLKLSLFSIMQYHIMESK